MSETIENLEVELNINHNLDEIEEQLGRIKQKADEASKKLKEVKNLEGEE